MYVIVFNKASAFTFKNSLDNVWGEVEQTDSYPGFGMYSNCCCPTLTDATCTACSSTTCTTVTCDANKVTSFFFDIISPYRT